MKPFRPDNVDSLPGVLIEAWIDAVATEKEAETALNRARTARMNASLDLAKSVAPPEAEVGEKVLLPHQGRFIQVEYRGSGDPIISFRDKQK